jgi:hypothetical protein
LKINLTPLDKRLVPDGGNQEKDSSVTPRTAGRAAGGLFFSVFALYGGGTFLVASTTGGAAAVPENTASLVKLAAGATLLLLNSVAVIMIGALAFRVLRRTHRRTAVAYLATRTVEAVLLALAPLGMLTLALLTAGDAQTSTTTGSRLSGLARALVGNSDSAYSIAMATLGVGSIVFCWTLLRSGLLPRSLAVWGLAGYAILALGSVLELTGYAVGLAMSVPGGLFELAAGCYLLVKGFRQVGPNTAGLTQDTGPTTTTPTAPLAVAATGTHTSDTR